MSRNRTETVAKYLPKKASACSRESVASLKLYQMVKSGDKMASNPDIFAPRIAVANRSARSSIICVSDISLSFLSPMHVGRVRLLLCILSADERRSEESREGKEGDR